MTAIGVVLAEIIGTGRGGRPGDDVLPALEAAVRAILAKGRAAWPGVAVDEESFARWLAERVASEDEPARALELLSGEDLFLACGCAAADHAAVAAFDKIVRGVVGPSVRRIDPSAAFADEVRELTLTRLAVAGEGKPPRIAGYRGQGNLRSWVQVAAVRIALDLRRSARPASAGSSEAADPLVEVEAWDDDPELECVRQLYRDDFAGAFREALGTLSSRERNVLRMSALDRLSIDQIGAVYRVHRATVARWIGKTHEKLFAETRQRLQARLKITEREFESLMFAVRSHIDLSIDRFLNASGP
ncbi:MAG: sigma-70 family RNA polymerase sigma factor [Deltaproteobacteria bacterium]|nr:sigma-70 family RNA polymerase sigma factor [Deltaproteobacteria bacterium]